MAAATANDMGEQLWSREAFRVCSWECTVDEMKDDAKRFRDVAFTRNRSA